jgi:hypothetical protein
VLEMKWYTSALVYADDVNILGGSRHSIKKNTEGLIVTSKEVGVEVRKLSTWSCLKIRMQDKSQHEDR